MNAFFPDAAPTLVVPDIRSSAMLVDASVSCWSGNRLDREATEDITINSGAASGVARVRKSLMGDNANLRDVHKAANALRTTHRMKTLPWGESSTRLLVTASHTEYVEVMSKLQDEFVQAAETFLHEESYWADVEQARIDLGSMFDPADYPHPDQLRQRFGVTLTFMPIPDSADFRLDINEQAMERMRRSYEEHYQNAVQGASKAVWERVRSALEKLAHATEVPEDGSKRRIRESTFDGAVELVGFLRDWNLEGSTQMSAIADKLEATFQGVDRKDLKDYPEVRDEVRTDITSVLATLPSLDM